MNSGDTFPCASWRGETRVAGGPQGRRSAHPEPSLRSRPTRHARPATALDGLLRGAPACQVLAFQLHQVQQKNPACSRVTGHSVTTRVPTALVPSLLAGAARAVPPSKECCGPRVARRPRVRASHARVGNAAGLAHSTNWHGAVPSSALRISPPVAPAPAQREGTDDECCRCMRPPAPRPVAGCACCRHPTFSSSSPYLPLQGACDLEHLLHTWSYTLHMDSWCPGVRLALLRDMCMHCHGAFGACRNVIPDYIPRSTRKTWE